MKITYQDKTYYVGFEHDHEPRLVGEAPLLNWTRGRTICVISSGPKEAPEMIAYGEANCAEGDRFVKEIGRKMSLARALESYWPNDREARKAFWAAYHGRKA